MAIREEGIISDIIKGDALKVLKKYKDGHFNLIVTSPPYNIGKAYETKTSIELYLNEQEIIIAELVRVLSENGSICWQVGNYKDKKEVFPLDIYYYQIFKKLGLKLRNRIIWHFRHGLHSKNQFSGRYETILWFSKTDEYIFNLDPVRVASKYPGKRHYKGDKKGQPSGNPKGKNPADVWDIMLKDWKDLIWDIPNVKANHIEKTLHPCQFPVELVERCVLALSNENDWVLDPFSGAGSTVIGSLKNGRNSVGIERDGAYVQKSKERIKFFIEGNLKTRPMTQKIHVPKDTDKVANIPIEWK